MLFETECDSHTHTQHLPLLQVFGRTHASFDKTTSPDMPRLAHEFALQINPNTEKLGLNGPTV